MLSGKPWKVILLFTLPILLGNLIQQLYNVTDGIIVGNFVSESALASVGLCQPLTILLLALAIGLSVGVTVVVSQYYGANRKDELPMVINTALILLGVCGLALTVIGYFAAPFLLEKLLSVPESNLPNSILYMRVYVFGLTFQFVYNGMAASLRALGDSKATLYFLIIAVVFNAIASALAVIVFDMGVFGAALMTVVAQIICAIVSFIYLNRKINLKQTERRWDGKMALLMAKLGMPIAIQMGIVSIGNGSMYRLVNGFAATVPGIVPAYTTVLRVENLLYVPIMAFQSGMASFTGQNIGANRMDRVKQGLISTLIMSVSLLLLESIFINIFAGSVLSLFGIEAVSMQIGIQQIRYMSMFYWMFATYMTLGGLLQGAGDTILMSCATLTALAMRILFGYLSVYLGILSYNAAWVTCPIGWLFALAISYTRFFTGGWKKKAVARRSSHEPAEMVNVESL